METPSSSFILGSFSLRKLYSSVSVHHPSISLAFSTVILRASSGMSTPQTLICGWSIGLSILDAICLSVSFVGADAICFFAGPFSVGLGVVASLALAALVLLLGMI